MFEVDIEKIETIGDIERHKKEINRLLRSLAVSFLSLKVEIKDGTIHKKGIGLVKIIEDLEKLDI